MNPDETISILATELNDAPRSHQPPAPAKDDRALAEALSETRATLAALTFELRSMEKRILKAARKQASDLDQANMRTTIETLVDQLGDEINAKAADARELTEKVQGRLATEIDSAKALSRTNIDTAENLVRGLVTHLTQGN